MRILIDLQGAQTESRFRGIGRYSTSLAQAMVKEAGKHDVWICLNAMLPESMESIHAAFDGLVPPSRIVTFDAVAPVAWPDPNNAWRRGTAELLRESFIHGLRPDVVHVSSLFEGAQDTATLSIGKFRHRPRTAVTLYDLIPLLNPDDYLSSDWTRAWYMDRVESLKRSDIMLSISEHARQEAMGALGIDGSRIVNISSAISDMFKPRQVGAAEIHVLQSRFGIRDRYVMYSGAMESRKNVARLLEAFSLLPVELQARHHLVIAGNISESDRERLWRSARHLGIAERLVLTGYISDDELITLYSACALYVFPSLHEGFGLPALEAMACGAPTIGSCTTSVPEVIGRGDALFDPTDSVAMATSIVHALTNEEFNRSLREHAPVQAAKFSWAESARHAIAALEDVHAHDSRPCAVAWATVQAEREVEYRDLIDSVAALPVEPMHPGEFDLVATAEAIAHNQLLCDGATRYGDMPEHINWRVEGPFDSSYSLALLNRETALALEGLGHRVALHSTEGPGDFEPDVAFLERHPDLAELHRRAATVPPEQAEVSSRNLYPPRVADMRSRFNLLHHYAWEESAFPQEWVADFNEHLQGMTCLSRHVEKVMIDNGVSVPLFVSGCGVDHWERVSSDSGYQVPGKVFRFLHVSSCFPRKGADVLLKAYGQAFTSDDDVTLVIKTFPNPHNHVHEWLEAARQQQPNYPDVVIIEEDLSDAQLKVVYEQCHALVAPSRAEGFGLPLAEAMLSGLPVITTAWGGQLDFCSDQTAWLVDYTFTPATTHFALFNSVWAEPDQTSLAQTMRVVYELPSHARREKSERGRELLLGRYKWRDVASRLVESARSFATGAHAQQPRIGWVTTWNTKCGIATYSSHLLGSLPHEVTIFAARTEALTHIDGPNVLRSWRTDDQDPLEQLADSIEAAGVTTVVIQFQYSFFGFAQFERFLTRQIEAGRVVVVMMHATTDAPETPYKRLGMLAGVLRRCHRILVHAAGDLNRLKAIGVIENVALFPHGMIDFPSSTARLAGQPFTISSYGFFLPHKGLPQLIEAVGQLVAGGRDVRLKMVNAEYPVPESRHLIESARLKIDALGLSNHVCLITDFLTDDESLAELQDSDLVVFPYQGTGESASGAVRYGLASGRQVAVTPLRIFEDLGQAVCRFSGQTPDNLAEGLARFVDRKAGADTGLDAIADEASRWREAHRYSSLGLQLGNMLEQLTSIQYGKSTTH